MTQSNRCSQFFCYRSCSGSIGSQLGEANISGPCYLKYSIGNVPIVPAKCHWIVPILIRIFGIFSFKNTWNSSISPVSLQYADKSWVFGGKLNVNIPLWDVDPICYISYERKQKDLCPLSVKMCHISFEIKQNWKCTFGSSIATEEAV